MIAMARFLSFGLALTTAAAQLVPQNYSSRCSSIASEFKHPNVTINFAEHVPANTNLTFSQAYGLATCLTPSQVVPVDLCRVAMYVSTSNRSGITLEAWLPTNWTGRFLSTGNGGLDGCIQYTDVAYATSFGFAAVGANNGHNGTSGLPFYQNEEVVIDFAWRSLYTETVVGKAITKAYYKEDLGKSYYLGCSTGGREGFKMVQDHPELFDGVVVGAPALAFNNLTSWSGHFYTISGTNASSAWLSPAKWALVHDDILRQCDGLDGAKDGILEDPSLCVYKPVAIQCSSKTNDTSACLTPPQVQTVTKYFQGYYGTDGVMVYPAMQPGSELLASLIYYTGEPFSYTTDWFRYAVLEDPTWDPATLNSTYASLAAAVNPGGIQTWKGDLSAFKNKGGRILHYHGQADPIITSFDSPRYYTHVADKMALNPDELDEFYRFFRISGMGHCEGGNGAWSIGQVAVAGAPTDAQDNVLMRMVEWVEKGDEYAPETVRGTKYVNDTVSLGVEIVRDHCKFPKRNVCIDAAASEKAESWKCME